MKDYIKKIDMFGLNYEFLMDKQSKFQTSTGAYLTISYLIIVVLLFMGFGINFYMRRNPKVSGNNFIGKYTKNYFSNENATLAFRIANTAGFFYEDQTVIKVNPSLMSYKFNETSQALELEYKLQLSLKKCRTLPNINDLEEYYKTNLENWYCIDFDELTSIGGGWDGNFVQYIRIDTNQCINSTSNNNSCVSYADLLNEFAENGNLFFSYLYMVGQPRLSDYYNPLVNSLVNNYEILDTRITKKRNQIYKKIILENDNGWLVSSINNISIYSLDSQNIDFNFKDPQNNPLLFRFNFYVGKNYDSYLREYSKIQEIFAQVGGFSNFFYIILLTIYDYSRETYKTTLITKRIPFEISESKDKNLSPIIDFSNKFNLSPLIKISNDFNLSPLKNNFENQKSELIVEEESKNSNIQDITSRKIFIPKQLFIEKKPHSESFSFLVALKGIFCPSKISELEKEKLFVHTAEKNYIQNVFEVTTMINLYNEFQYIKKLVLNKYQISALKFLHPQISEDEEEIEISRKNLIDYLTEIQKVQELNEIDKKLLIWFDCTEQDMKINLNLDDSSKM